MLSQDVTATGAQITDVPKVSQETTMIQKLLAENKELANTLEQRLHVVLRPVAGAESSGTQGVPAPAVSPLVADLASFREQLAAIANHYLDILNRLEV